MYVHSLHPGPEPTHSNPGPRVSDFARLHSHQAQSPHDKRPSHLPTPSFPLLHPPLVLSQLFGLLDRYADAGKAQQSEKILGPPTPYMAGGRPLFSVLRSTSFRSRLSAPGEPFHVFSCTYQLHSSTT